MFGALLALAGSVAASPLLAQGDGRSATSWHWDGSVAAGAWARVYDVNGSITVTPSPDGAVHVRAEKRVHDGGDVTAVHFAVVQGRDGATICALWGDSATCEPDGPRNNESHHWYHDRRQNVEVTFTVQIPPAVRSGATTVNGSVHVSRVASDVEARTVNGGVRVEQTGGAVNAKSVNGDVAVNTRGGPVRASSVNGSLDITMGQQGTSDMRFRSVNGSIEIRTPSTLNADVDLNTVNGDISSRYPLQYDRRRRHAEGTVGHGGPTLSASTVNGSVTLN